MCSSSVFRRNLFIRIPSRSNYFANSFFPYSINEWNKLDVAIRELDSLPLFKKSILEFIRPKPSPIYNIMDSLGLKLLTRLRVSMSHLKDHKHRHNFADTLVPLCNCGLLESETTSHFLLRCSFYGNQRKLLLDNIIEIIGDISNFSDENLVRVLLYGQENTNMVENVSILNNTIVFLKSSGRFEGPLF